MDCARGYSGVIIGIVQSDQRNMITIITVCRDSEKTIQRALDSLVVQTDQDFRLIIKDGMSTDRTLEIINAYRPVFGDRMEVVIGDDRGIYDALNIAINRVSGGFIGILHSDDTYEASAIENFKKAIKGSEADVYFGICRHCNSKGEEQCLVRYSDSYLTTKSLVTLEHPATLVSKECFKLNGGFSREYRIAGDYEFFLRLRLKSCRFLEIDKIVATHWSGGISQTKTIRSHIEMVKIKRKYRLLTRVEALLTICWIAGSVAIKKYAIGIFRRA